MRRHSTTVSFRADDELLALVDRERKPFGISRGDWVRGVVVSRVFDRANDTLIAQVEQSHSRLDGLDLNLAKLRKANMVSLYTLLVHVGGLDPAEAKSIVKKLFNGGDQS